MTRTLICAPVMVDGESDAARAVLDAGALGADLVELRIDPLAERADLELASAVLAPLLDAAPLPCVVTCRSESEGGLYGGPPELALDLYEVACRHARPPRYIDVEHALLGRRADVRSRVGELTRGTGVGLIVSWHDFRGRPPSLMRTVEAMRGVAGADVLKIAFRARSLRDNLEVFDLLAERDRPTIALAMGEAGSMSRVLAPKFGGLLTFASVTDESATAPGQPTIAELEGTYRFREIGRGTRVLGVIGDPVSHSIGPEVHNAALEALGQDAVYVRMPVAGSWESFKATVVSLLEHRSLDFAGASVTLPHKEHLLRLALEDTTRRWEVEGVARRAGAANTVAVGPGGDCVVTNTDVEGIVGPLREALGESLRGARVSVLGAGGAARAAAAGLTEAGARVTIHARRVERARAIADALADNSHPPPVAARWDEGLEPGTLAVVNCTPIGMSTGGSPGESALSDGSIEGLGGEAVVFDTVYRPLETPLIRRARSRGLRTIDGLAMFTRQASEQIRAWTGREAPSGLIERLSREIFASS